MTLQVIHVNHRDAQTPRETLGKAHTHQEAPHQTRTPRERHRIQILLRDASPLDGCIHHRHNVLLMGTARQLRHHPTILLMHSLRSRHIAQQDAILQHRRTRVIARTLYCKYIHIYHVSASNPSSVITYVCSHCAESL